MWGQVRKGSRRNIKHRIIPTRVGTRYGCQLQCLRQQDHPHACGDKDNKLTWFSYRLGSSPRVWGQVNTVDVLLIKVGIIPTRVGTSFLLYQFL